jgi:hypothetical protein
LRKSGVFLGDNAIGIQFHSEAISGRLEEWFIGHACEIGDASGVSVNQLRDQFLVKIELVLLGQYAGPDETLADHDQRNQGGDIGRVNSMQRQLALVMLSALRDRDTDKALKTSLIMLQWEKHRLALRANAPKRVKNDWWKDYLPVSSLSNEEQEDWRRRCRASNTSTCRTLVRRNWTESAKSFWKRKFGRKFSNGGC